jgi:hypothetical protein
LREVSAGGRVQWSAIIGKEEEFPLHAPSPIPVGRRGPAAPTLSGRFTAKRGKSDGRFDIRDWREKATPSKDRGHLPRSVISILRVHSPFNIFPNASAPRGRVALPWLKSPRAGAAGKFQKIPAVGSIFLHSAPRGPFIRPPTKQGRPGHGWIHPLRP